MKGIQIVGTGDCVHPLWLNELKNNLIKYSNGLFVTPQVLDVNFILQTEVDVIWKNDLKVKKVHFIILFPSFLRFALKD